MEDGDDDDDDDATIDAPADPRRTEKMEMDYYHAVGEHPKDGDGDHDGDDAHGAEARQHANERADQATADHHENVGHREGRCQANHKSFKHGLCPQKEGPGAQEDAQNLLHQIPDRPGGNQRDGDQDDKLTLAQQHRAENQKTARGQQEARRT